MKTGGLTKDGDSTGSLRIDPFAVDFFGTPASLTTTELPTGKVGPVRRRRRRDSEWFRRLPKISNEAAGFSVGLRSFPTSVQQVALAVAAESLGRLAGTNDLVFEVNAIEESVLAASLAESSLFRTVVVVTAENNVAALVLDNTEISGLIGRMLGSNENFGEPRHLSPTESVIVEFIVARVLSELNRMAGGQRFAVRGISAGENLFAVGERGAEARLQFKNEDLSLGLRLLMPPGFIRATADRFFVVSNLPLILADARRLAPRGLEISAEIGETTLDAASLSDLEAGDIVVISRPAVAGAGEFGNDMTWHFGRGGLQISGRPTVSPENGELLLVIDEIKPIPLRRSFSPAKFMTDEFENDDAVTDGLATQSAESGQPDDLRDDAPLANGLEHVQVALRVEIAGNRISLRELQELRVGQVIGLGCGPLDPVRLVTDANDEPVATGELIEIEGQLGVRLLKVFV